MQSSKTEGRDYSITMESFIQKVLARYWSKFLNDEYYRLGWNKHHGDKDREGFLNWYLNTESSVYMRYAMVHTSIKELEVAAEYTLINLYHDDESNIPTWTLTIGKEYHFGYRKMFLSEEDALAEWDKWISHGYIREGDLPKDYYIPVYGRESRDVKDLPMVLNSKALTIAEYLSIAPECHHDYLSGFKGSFMCPTTYEWCGTWPEGYVCVSMWNTQSNYDLYTLHMMGTDDCSYSIDFLGKEAAFAGWEKALTCSDLTPETFENSYFSN